MPNSTTLNVMPAGEKRRRWQILSAFVLTYASVNGLMLLAVVEAFHSPHTAGMILLLRTLPGFFVGWLTGFAADWHKTELLGWVMVGVAAGMFFLPLSVGLLCAGLVMSWVEVSFGALLSEQKHAAPKASAVAVGYGYDVAKLISVGAAFLLATQIGVWVLAVTAAAGVSLFRKAYAARPQNKREPFRWKTAAVVPALMTLIASLGVNNILWLQGRYNATLTLFLVAAAGFAVGAILGNTTVLFVKGWAVGYPLAILGLFAMTVSCLVIAAHLGETPIVAAVCGVWFVYGWGCATAWQSARTILFASKPLGREVAMFTTLSRIGVATGGVLLSLSIPYDNIVITASGIAAITVLAVGWAISHRSELV